ncbi:MAG TPA: hypothetical protein VGR89_03705, partial [Puia sp.]|nr:hypothetical protein [Puia sp.]
MRRKFWVFVRIFAYDKERGKRKMHWWAKSRAFGGFVLIPYAMIFLTWSFFAPQAFAGAARPNIKDSKDWKKMDASQLTGDWRDNRKIIWRNISRNKGTQRKYSGALVVRADGKGNADIWAGNFGLHFFDKATHKVKTPIDLSPLGLKHGPEIDYVFGSDGSLSYFYVQWCKTKIGIGQ